MQAELINVKQYAERIGVSTDTIRRWGRQGFGPRPVRLGPRAVRYRLSDVEAWIEQRGAA